MANKGLRLAGSKCLKKLRWSEPWFGSNYTRTDTLALSQMKHMMMSSHLKAFTGKYTLSSQDCRMCHVSFYDHNKGSQTPSLWPLGVLLQRSHLYGLNAAWNPHVGAITAGDYPTEEGSKRPDHALGDLANLRQCAVHKSTGCYRQDWNTIGHLKTCLFHTDRTMGWCSICQFAKGCSLVPS